MAVTVGLLGDLGYVGIDAVLVPTPPRRFGGGVREPVEIPRKLAEGVRGERNIVLQRVDMQLHFLHTYVSSVSYFEEHSLASGQLRDRHLPIPGPARRRPHHPRPPTA